LRQTILLGLPPLLGLAAALAFWPTRRGGARPRTLALLVLVATYGIAVTVSPPGAPLLSGLALLLLVAAWLWLPSRDPRDALVGGALVLAAGALALPLAARFDGDEAWLDYRDWQWAWYAAGGGESFNWDQSYGPIDWPRTGKALLEVRSDAPHYWRTAVLDQFDGIRWLRSEQGANGNLELPRRTSGSQFTPQTVPLNPRWMDEITFTVRDLRSDLVVGAGAVLSVDGLGGVAPAPGGLTPAAGVPLSEGDSYTVRAYVPDPTADEMRSAGTRYPSALASYAALDIPTSRNAHRRKPGPPQRSSYASQVTTRQLAVPLRGSAPQAQRAAARALSASAYGGVYRLARRLTDDAPTPYDAVQSVQDYLQGNYDYRENPPDHNYPLRAFLFDDRFGYCQQFSGAMALMLRMVGIPTRVAGGFSPGTPSRKDDGAYVVRDLDAHSWVEVYFNGIGWVPFDPTPPAAPAQSQTNGLGLFANAPSVGKALLKEAGHSLDARRPRPVVASSSGDSLSLWLLPPLVLLLAVGGAAAALGVRALRSRALSPAAATEARLRELEAALRRLRAWTPGGTTLVVLERRLGFLAGPAAAAYAARLRAARYSPRDPGPPTAAERRALRRALSAGLGLLSRLRGFLAIPPGGPAAR